MAFTPEQHEAFDEYVMSLVKKGEFSDLSQREMAKELLAMEEDGKPVFWNEDTNQKMNERTLRSHITKFIKNAQNNAFSHQMKKNYMEEVFKASKDMADKPQTLKVVGEKFMPDKKDETDANKNSPRIIAILNRGRMEITDGTGAVTAIEGVGDQGHERLDSVHPLADRREEDTSIKTVSFTDDTTVHGLYHGEDSSERDTLPDPPVPPQDTDNNDSGSNLGTPE